jgi:hypothetical protein
MRCTGWVGKGPISARAGVYCFRKGPLRQYLTNIKEARLSHLSLLSPGIVACRQSSYNIVVIRATDNINWLHYYRIVYQVQKERDAWRIKKEVLEMKSRNIPAIVIVVVLLAVFGSMALAAQDRFTLKAPNGIAFSEFRGYEAWQDVAVSETDNGIKAILANPVMLNAYREGVPGNGKPFPEGSMIVKIEWSKIKNPVSPYSVMVPDILKSVSFIQKDSKRFPDTNGWEYAQFLYDAASDTFKPFGNDASFGKVCHACHTIVKARDFIFTGYPRR